MLTNCVPILSYQFSVTSGCPLQSHVNFYSVCVHILSCSCSWQRQVLHAGSRTHPSSPVQDLESTPSNTLRGAALAIFFLSWIINFPISTGSFIRIPKWYVPFLKDLKNFLDSTYSSSCIFSPFLLAQSLTAVCNCCLQSSLIHAGIPSTIHWNFHQGHHDLQIPSPKSQVSDNDLDLLAACCSLKHYFLWLPGYPLSCFYWLLSLSSWSPFHVGVPWTSFLSTRISLVLNAVCKLVIPKLMFLVMTSFLTPHLYNGETSLYQKWSKDGFKVKSQLPTPS